LFVDNLDTLIDKSYRIIGAWGWNYPPKYWIEGTALVDKDGADLIVYKLEGK